MPNYKTKKDLPGLQVGEEFQLDGSNPGNIVYKSVNFPNVWFQQNVVESQVDFEEIKDTDTLIAENEALIESLQLQNSNLQASQVSSIKG